MTLLAGFMMAESAVIGRLIGLAESLMSMMTTWDVSPTFSLTHINLSDSMVSELKPMLAALMPTLVSWKFKNPMRETDVHDWMMMYAYYLTDKADTVGMGANHQTNEMNR